MKISVNNQDLYTLTETQKKVIKNDIPEEVFEEDMKRRLHWALMHKYQQCFNRLKQEWEPKIKQRASSIPTNDDALAELIFSQPDYKNRSQREDQSSIQK